MGITAEARIDTAIESLGIERDLYYVVIEALNNTLKHADANEVELMITRENGCIYLCVADNGRGFDPSQIPTGLGINNMRERIEALGGELCIESATDEGTRVTATIPLTS